MNCKNYEEDLKAYIDGELPKLRSFAVRRHLTQCASCREEIITMTQIAEELRSIESEEVLPASLREKILGDRPPAPILGGQSGGPAGTDRHSSRKRPTLAWGLAGAALIAWFAITPILQKGGVNPQNSSPVASVGHAPLKEGTDTLTFRQQANESPRVTASAPVPTTVTYGSSNGVTAKDKSGDHALVVNASPSSSTPGAVQTYDRFSPPTSPEPLRQVHKEASIGVQVPNPETTGDTVATMVKEVGGYVAANNLSTGDDGLKSSKMTVKVPVTQFEPFLAQVAKLGSVQSKNITGEDITEKTSDANQAEGVLEDDVQKSEAGLKAMGSRAKWRDQEATRELRTQLAQARARLVLLKRLAALGTITVELTQTPKAVTPAPVTGGFLNTLQATTHDALQSLVGSASALLALLIWLLAYSPLWVTLFFVGRYVQKVYRRREA